MTPVESPQQVNDDDQNQDPEQRTPKAVEKIEPEDTIQTGELMLHSTVRVAMFRECTQASR